MVGVGDFRIVFFEDVGDCKGEEGSSLIDDVDNRLIDPESDLFEAVIDGDAKSDVDLFERYGAHDSAMGLGLLFEGGDFDPVMGVGFLADDHVEALESFGSGDNDGTMVNSGFLVDDIFLVGTGCRNGGNGSGCRECDFWGDVDRALVSVDVVHFVGDNARGDDVTDFRLDVGDGRESCERRVFPRVSCLSHVALPTREFDRRSVFSFVPSSTTIRSSNGSFS